MLHLIAHAKTPGVVTRITGHWYVVLLACLLQTRAVFSLVEGDNRRGRLVIWTFVLVAAVTLLVVATCSMANDT